MFCANCGKKIPDESLYCMFCGKSANPAEPIEPDSKKEPFENIEEEWEGRAVWEACRREQEQIQLELAMKDHFEPANAEIESEPIVETDLTPEIQDFSDFQLPIEEDFHLEEPNLPESEWDTLILSDCVGEEASSTQKVCKRCGKPLAQTSISDYCLDCLYSSDVLHPDVADFDSLPEEIDAPKLDLPEEPVPARKNRLLMIVLVIAAVLALGASAVFFISKYNGGSHASNAPSQSTMERKENNRNKAIESAHKMIREAAFAPDSIHFDSSSLECTVEAGDYTVTQQFERKNPQGEVVNASYTAILNLGGDTDYIPIMLKVDDSILFDHR